MYVFDLDGVLAESKSRQHFAIEKKWDQFHVAGLCADVVRHNKVLFDVCTMTVKTIILTGRSNKYRAQTENWLNTNGFRYDALIMRLDGDYRPAPDFKLDYLQNQQLNRVTMFFDDREDTVTRMLQNGIPAIVVTE